ncbi:MAG: site-specific DNA-methyltransferase, partial [Acetobacter sp.]|nr:site-specific DNA-methyltransferase [Acetobacter sp.]
MAYEKSKDSLIDEINKRVEDKILEKTNADLLIKLINQADSLDEAISIAALGTTYKRTGFHFDKRLEKLGDAIRYFKRNETLSFVDITHNTTQHNTINPLAHKLIIGDNYQALQNLLIQYRNQVNVIYIDPPYGKDSMGEFAQTNYTNAITRDNLLSMLYPRLVLARQLLSDDGVFFCSIDDRNQAYVKCLFDEVFGENNFVASAARVTKKAGKSTEAISKNHDYLLIYRKNILKLSQLDVDADDYSLKDEYYAERGGYKLSQTLDYDSLQYSKTMDYEADVNGVKFYPGGKEKWLERQNGKFKKIDWVWRWSQEKLQFGIENGFVEIKNNRIYTKTYLNATISKKPYEIEYISRKKNLSSIEFIENKYSNDIANKDIQQIFNEKNLFNYSKPISLLKKIISIVPQKDSLILDFFAGSGTTGEAVLKLNREDGGNRKFILCQNNEKTDTTPHGIAYDVTAKRLKRVMTGECYDGTKPEAWLKKNEPYGGGLEVYEIGEVSSFQATEGKTPFEVIDETLYGKEKFETIKEKIEWVCTNFEKTQKYL